MLLPPEMLHAYEYFSCKFNDVVACASMNTIGTVENKLNAFQ